MHGSHNEILVQLKELRGVVKQLQHAAEIVLLVLVNARPRRHICHKEEVLEPDVIRYLVVLVQFRLAYLIKPFQDLQVRKPWQNRVFIHIGCQNRILDFTNLLPYSFVLIYFSLFDEFKDFAFVEENGNDLEVSFCIDVQQV